MNVTVNTSTLAQELRHLTKISAAKPTIPILGHILLKAEDRIYLSATKIEMAMSTVCAGSVQETGYLTIPAHTLLGMLDQLPDGDMTLTTENNHVRLLCGGFSSKLSTLPVKDFPAFPVYEGTPAVVSAVAFTRMIERTAYAISDKVQKYVLDGAFFSLVGDVMAMVATDGKRLSVATASRTAGEDFSTIVPSQTLELLAGQGLIGELSIGKTDRHLFFQAGSRTLVSSLIDGEFPNYQRIIPKDTPYTLQADRMALISMLKRVGVIDETCYLSLEPGRIGCRSRSAHVGEAEEQMEAIYQGPSFVFGVRGKSLLDFLERATEPQANLAIKDEGRPLLFTDGVDFINVIMVIRT